MSSIYETILNMADGYESPRRIKLNPSDLDELAATGLDVETDPQTGEILIRDVNQNRITFIDKRGKVTK